MSQRIVADRRESVLDLLETMPELAEPIMKFAEAIIKIREGRGTLDEMEGGLLESQRAMAGELLPALVIKRAREAEESALAAAGTKRFRKKRS